MTASSFKLVLCAVALSLSQAACRPSDAEIKKQIDEANFCTTPADCSDLGSHCPFSCHVLVNKQHATRISALIDDFERSGGQQCLYSCIAVSGISCEARKCVPIIGSP